MKLSLDFEPPLNLLQGKNVLITGAGDGIGRALALGCARVGATVVLLGRTLRKLEAVYDAIEAAAGPKPAIFGMDLRGAHPEHYQQLREAIANELGGLDAIVHNAGVLGPRTPIEHYPALEWFEVLHVNANAPFLLSQTLLPLLKQAEDARIIFTSSGVGRVGRAYWGAYAVSKFATEGLMQVLASELETENKVRVMSINPGPTRTQMRASAYPAEDPSSLKTPEALVPAYLYLLGPAGHALHGRALDAQ